MVRSASARRLPPTPGSTTARWTASGMYGSGVAQDERALEDVLRRDPVGDVDDLRLGRDPLHHAVAGADEVVLEPEVGQERDEHSESLRRCRGVRHTRCACDRLDEAVEVVSVPPRRPRRRRVRGPRGSSPGRSRPPGGRARAPRTPARPRRRRARRGLPPGASRARARASGRGRRCPRRAPRRGRAAHRRHPRRAPGQAAAEARPRDPPGSRPGARAAGSSPCSRSAAAVPGPIAATPRKIAAAAPSELVRAARARDHDPVVAGDVDLVRPGRLELEQRAEHDLEPERLEPLGERLGLLARPRDDHAQRPSRRDPSLTPTHPGVTHGSGRKRTRVCRICRGFGSICRQRYVPTRVASSAASAAGSSPLRRSTQLPSSAATSAVSVSPS